MGHQSMDSSGGIIISAGYLRRAESTYCGDFISELVAFIETSSETWNGDYEDPEWLFFIRSE